MARVRTPLATPAAEPVPTATPAAPKVTDQPWPFVADAPADDRLPPKAETPEPAPVAAPVAPPAAPAPVEPVRQRALRSDAGKPKVAPAVKAIPGVIELVTEDLTKAVGELAGATTRVMRLSHLDEIEARIKVIRAVLGTP